LTRGQRNQKRNGGRRLMSIFGRYVFRQAAGALLLILLSLSGIVWIALALRQLNLVTTQGQDAWVFLAMTTLALPNLMALIAPIALLIASIHVLNRLNSDSELIVLTASGATIMTVARPLILLGLIVPFAVSMGNHFVMPWSLRLLREYVIQVRTDLISQVLQPGKFSTPEPNLTFHIRDRALNGELLGILMHDGREQNQSMSYLAERGTIVKQQDTSFLVMSTGHIVRKPNPKEAPQIITFQTYAIDLERFEPKGESTGMKPRERYFSELAYPEPNDQDFKRQPGHFRAELHERFASPLYPLAFVLIALASVGQARSTRQNRVESVVVGFVCAAAVRLGGLAINNLVVLRASATPLMYLLPLAAILISIVIIRLNARQRRGPTLPDRLSLSLDRIRAALVNLVPRRSARLAAGD
jgi:lipopolysaccharide export system permease protein